MATSEPVRTCDLCSCTIEARGDHATLVLPITPDLREQIRVELMRDAPGLGPLGLAFASVPASYQFDICVECVEGILPDLPRLMRDGVTAILERVQRQRAAGRGVE